MNELSLDSHDLQWLSRLARALLGEHHLAEDLVQDTVAATLRKPPPAGASQRAWLGGIARRLAHRHRRSEIRRARREGGASRSEALPAAADLVERAEVAERVAAATRALPEPYRRAILLRYLEGVSAEEIARREGKPADTVRWRLRRGLELLREELGRRESSDGRSWMVLLLPLARLSATSGPEPVGVSSIFMTAIAAGVTMKTVLIGAVLAAGLWILWPLSGASALDAPPEMEIERSGSLTVSEEEPGGSEEAANPASREAIETSFFIAPEPARAPTEVPRGLRGMVMDESGDAIAQAVVYLFQPKVGALAKDDKEAGLPLAKAQCDDGGAFSFTQGILESVSTAASGPLALGVVANGFLRQTLPEVNKQAASGEVVVVLSRGGSLRGRVIDEQGRTVPGIELLAHSTSRSVSHVSPTQVMLRAERALFSDPSAAYHQCRSRSDASGEVHFRGLAPGSMRVRSLDPGWILTDPEESEVDGPYVTWTAKPALGVRLSIVDEATGEPVGRASATFSVLLTFTNGETKDYEQWVGRGVATITFALTPDLLPPSETRTIAQAVFSGTVKVDGIRYPWVAKPITPAGEVAEVRVPVSPPKPASALDAARSLARSAQEVRPPATIELDVRYSDGSLCETRLAVSYVSRKPGAPNREGDVDLDVLGPARYRLEVPSGEVSLKVHEWGSSGSLDEWSGVCRCEPGVLTRAQVTLPRGGTVTLERPRGWRGAWHVRASWREKATDEWRGSWGYGSETGTLTLRALRPAEWRFELQQDSESDPEPLERTTLLAEGQHVRLRD